MLNLSRIAIASASGLILPRRRATRRRGPRRSYRNNKNEKKEVCIRKPPSWLSRNPVEAAGATAKTAHLAENFRGRTLQTRVGRVDVTPVDLARRPAQLATEIASETSGLLDFALDGADLAARRANVFEIAAELFQQRIELAQLFVDLADIRMTAVKLMRDLVSETVDLGCFLVNVTNTYAHNPTPSRLNEPALRLNITTYPCPGGGQQMSGFRI